MSNGYRKELEDSVSDIAAYWLVRLSSDDCTPTDRLEFEAWKAKSPANERAFNLMQLHNSMADRLSGDEAIQSMLKQARTDTQLSWWRRKNIRIAAVAASLVAAVSIWNTSVFISDELPAEAVVASIEAYETVVGERSAVTLSDGSVVTLNTDSRIEIDYSEKKRRINLIRGQGYFDVAKDFSRPFSVLAGGKEVLALGTVFDVRIRDENLIQVTLVEGSVEVGDVPPASLQPEIPAARKVRLKAGERLVAELGKIPEVKTTDTEVETSWRTGRLVFNEKGLVEAIEEINRYSTQKLVLSDDQRLRAIKVSGVFSAGRTSTFVNALEVLHPVTISRSGSNESTLVWRE